MLGAPKRVSRMESCSWDCVLPKRAESPKTLIRRNNKMKRLAAIGFAALMATAALAANNDAGERSSLCADNCNVHRLSSSARCVLLPVIVNS